MPVVINGTTGITTPKLDALDLELGSKNVVERGSNANGEYVRFADGTQICMKETAFSAPGVILASGPIYATADAAWNYPAAFQGGLVVLIPSRVAFGGAWCGAAATPNTGTTGYSVLLRGTSLAVPVTWDGLAIGRWY